MADTRRGGLPAALVLALLAGVLQAQSLADPWRGATHGWLQIASLAVLVALVLRWTDSAAPASARSGRQRVLGAALLCWAFATAWLVATFWWLYISMHVYGGLPAALAALAVLALAAALALYYGLAGAGWAVLLLRGRRPPSAPWVALLFAAAWTLAELARGSWFTGFPWGAGGYAHVDGLLSAAARWVGVYGMGLLAACVAAALASAWTALGLRGRRAALGLALAVLLLAGGYGALRSPPVAESPASLRMDVALLQGNIAQDVKFVPGSGIADALQWYGQQLASEDSTLVVTPETALPLLPAQLPADYLPALQARYEAGGQAALVGLPLGSHEHGYTNSALGWQPGEVAGSGYRYDKHHLVPFGEFIPPLFRWFTDLLRIPLGDFARGLVAPPSMHWRGQRLAPNICYEDLFGEELATRFRDPATAPTAFVNMSNIAWFGNTVAIDQHLAISRMRALEFERPVLRATNTGATAIIDDRGRVTARLVPETRAVLHGWFEGRTHVTPYAGWVARWGLQPLVWLCLLLLAAGAWSGFMPTHGPRRSRPRP